MSGWREETGVATRIAWGERGANDGRTGLVSGLWYLLDVIDGERRGGRRSGEREGAGSPPPLSVCSGVLFHCFKKRTWRHFCHVVKEGTEFAFLIHKVTMVHESTFLFYSHSFFPHSNL